MARQLSGWNPSISNKLAVWLNIWYQTNRVALAGRGMLPLPADVALSYGELAEQPLLLLMLALYDADTNVSSTALRF